MGGGFGDEVSSSSELDGMGRGGGAGQSHEENNETGSAEVVSITGVVEVERDANVNTFFTNLTRRDIRIGFGIEFVGRIGTQPGKTQTIEDTEFGWVRSFVE